MRPTSVAVRAAGLVAAVVLAKAVVQIGRNPSAYQWDLSAYYYSSLAIERRVNVYDRAVFREIAGPTAQGFVYPPLTLQLFRPLSLMPYNLAYYAWLGAKVAALVALLALWRRRFVGENQFPVFAAWCVFGFGASLIRDLNAGNISIFEQLGLWLGIAALLEGRAAVFAILLAAVAQFKLLPMGLLVLLAVPRPNWRAMATCVGIFALLLGLNFVVYPDLTREFLQAAGGLDERGLLNPSSFAAARDLVETLLGYKAFGTVVDELLYLVFVAALAGATLWGILARPHQQGGENDRLVIGFACTAFALSVPRLKPYSYALLLVPAWHLLTHTRSRAVLVLGIVAIAASSNYVVDLLPAAGGHWPLFTALVLWTLYLWELRARVRQMAPRTVETPPAAEASPATGVNRPTG